MRRLALATIATVAALAAGCGSDDDGPATSGLPDGVASGPGFRFDLGDGWERVDLDDEERAELDAEIASEIPGLDPDGYAAPALFARTGEGEGRPIVSVVIEPVTDDTTLDDIALSSSTLIASIAEEPPSEPEPARLGSEEARRVTYVTDERDTTVLVGGARDGVAYSVTVQRDEGDRADIDAIVDRVSRTWRRVAPSAAEARDLDRLRVVDGTGYRARLPLGWRVSAREALGAQAPPQVDTFWRGHVGTATATSVNVVRTPDRGGTLAERTAAVIDEERTAAQAAAANGYRIDDIRRGDDTTLDGVRAATIDIRSRVGSVRLRQRITVAPKGGRLVRLALTAAADRFARDEREVAQTLRTWRWDD